MANEISMPVSIPEPAQEIIQRLGAVAAACHEPRLDRAAVEAAVGEHLSRMGVEPLPVEWVSDAKQVYEPLLRTRPVQHPTWRLEARLIERLPWRQMRRLAEMTAGRAIARTTWRTAWSAARAAAGREFEGDSFAWQMADAALWSTVEIAVQTAGRRAEPLPPANERLTQALLPLVDGLEAGLWLLGVTPRSVVAVPRPALHIEDRLPHRPDGPAVWWPGGLQFFFWRGVQVPAKVVTSPLDLTAAEITDEPNAEVRRVMLERYGAARYLQDIGAEMVHADDTGELYRAEVGDDEPLCMVRVVDKSVPPDGSPRTYWLRVPPNMHTAREAVAWTFELGPDEYVPVTET